MRNTLEIYLHLVWATRERHPCITAEVETAVYAAIRDKCMNYRCPVIAIGGVEDHVHLLVRAGARTDLEGMVRGAKGASLRAVNDTLGPNDIFAWEGFYGGFSIDPNAVETVIHDIENQKTLHAENTAPEYLERFLRNQSGTNK